MQRDHLLFFAGIACLGLSIGSFIAIFQDWVFLSSLSTGTWVSRGSAVAMIYFSLISIVSGIIGGLLVGKYAHVVGEYFKSLE